MANSRFLFTSRALFLVSALALTASGCSSADEATGDESGEDSAELRAGGNSGFFVVTRPDLRRCISPLCGGYFVKRVNATTSRCHDGSYANECYVSDLDLDGLGLSDQEKADFEAAAVSGKAIIRGGFDSFAWNQVRLAKLKATEGWKGASDLVSPAGTTYRVTSSGIKCVRAPCPTLVEAKLNSSKSSRIHEIDLGITAPQKLINEALASLDGDGILVTGDNTTFGARGSRGTQLVATEFYLRVKPAPVVTPVDQACGSRGMGPCPTGQYCDFPVSAACGTFDAAGTCKAQPDVCIKIYKPVCGCDGQTYGNSCMAHSAGVSVASEGVCP